MNRLLFYPDFLQLHVDLVRVRCLLAADGPERWPAGTIVDGESVGGQFKPSDQQGATAAAKPDKHQDLISTVADLWREVNQKVAAAIDTVKSLQNITPADVKEFFSTANLKHAAKLAVPIGLFLVATLGPEAAIALALGQALTATTLGSALFTGAGGLLLDKALDRLNLKDPKLKFAISLTASVLLHHVMVSKIDGLRAGQMLKDATYGKSYAGIANPRDLAQAELFTRHAKNEAIASFDRTGKFVRLATGTPDGVAIRLSKLDAYESIATHNHPSLKPYTLSMVDIESSLLVGRKQFRAVTRDAIFVVRNDSLKPLEALGSTPEERLVRLLPISRALQKRSEAVKRAMHNEFIGLYNDTVGPLMARVLAAAKSAKDIEKIEAFLEKLEEYRPELERLCAYHVMRNLERFAPELKYTEYVKNDQFVPTDAKQAVEQVVKELERLWDG